MAGNALKNEGDNVLPARVVSVHRREKMKRGESEPEEHRVGKREREMSISAGFRKAAAEEHSRHKWSDWACLEVSFGLAASTWHDGPGGRHELPAE